jgi:AAA domain, putative AbiEii toxin, Type IV TA system
LNKWFEIIDDIVPGFDIRFRGCNTETFEITVETVDGIIRMDQLSQGMISTISWIGLVLQRLYEVFYKSPAPEFEAGIVLIDEIDSHLHPEWQRLLVPSLRKHFPNLQVIASTHSPLLVGNMNAGELIRIRREEDRLVIEPIAQSYRGYRADQILTDAAFELESTRDVQWECMRSRFSELTWKGGRTEQEEKEHAELAAALGGMPGPEETTIERQAAELVQGALTTALEREISDDTKRRRLAEEAQLYLRKVISLGG